MEQIVVTHVNGTTLNLQSRTNTSKITRADQSVELLGVDTVDISVESATKLTFSIGDKITIFARDYTMNIPAKERKISESHFIYELQFEGVQYDLIRVMFNVNIDTTGNLIQDLNGASLTGDIKMFLDVIVANANRLFPGKWSVGNYPANTETKTLTFGESDTALSVLQSLCSEENYNTEFVIAIDGSGNRTIHVGQTGSVFSHTFQYGKGAGAYELTREKVSSSNIINRLFAYGSSQNLVTTKYRADVLCLPTKSKSQSYIEDSASITKYGTWEGSKVFDEVFPHRTGTISSLGSSVYKFVDSTMDFDLNERETNGSTKYLLAGQAAKVHFNTGKLAGYEFELSGYDHSTKTFTIKRQTDENDYSFPSETLSEFQFAIGDEYVLLDIYQPQSYIDAAESELNTKAAAYLAKYCQPRIQYGLIIDKMFLKAYVNGAATNVFWVGDLVPVKDTDLDIDKTIRITGFTRNLLDEFDYKLTVSDLPVEINTIVRTINDVKGLTNVVRINSLNDPARSRQNYRASQEVLNMIFDDDGYFTDKIRPLSIETSMLSVGAKWQQFGLSNALFEPTYQGAKNRIVYKGGVLAHYTLEDSNGALRTWTISDGDITLATDVAYYIYAKCSKTAATGLIIFDTAKILPDSDANYYHFLLGVANSVDATNNTRLVSLTYGGTTVNGRYIKTGRIVSNDGVTYFDLDTGEFKGTFKFTNGTNVETAVNSAASAASAAQSDADSAQTTANNAATAAATAQTTANNAATAASNAQTSANTANTAIANITADNVLSAAEKPSQRQAWDVIAAEKSGINSQATTFGITTENTAYNTAFQNLANYLNNGTTWSSGIPTWLADANLGTNTTIVGSTYRSNWSTFYSARTTLLNAIAAKARTLANNAQAAADSAASITLYLRTALQGSTDISGGLLATNVLLMKNASGVITGGFSGLSSDNIGMWTGGTYQNAIDALAKIILRKDGSGQLAGGKILFTAGGDITVGVLAIDAAGNLVIKDTGGVTRLLLTKNDISTLTAIEGSTQNTTVNNAIDYYDQAGAVTHQLANQITVNNNNSQLTVVTSIYSSMSTSDNSEGSTYVELRLVNVSTGAIVILDSMSLYLSGVSAINNTKNVNAVVNVQAGTYRLDIYYSHINYGNDMGFLSQVAASTATVFYDGSVQRTEIGKNGIGVIGNATNYSYFGMDGSTFKVVDKVTGLYDRPGILATATVGSTGASSNKWGGKVGNSSRSSTGVYVISHSIGHTNYNVVACANQYDRHVIYTSKGTTSVTINVKNGAGTLVDQQFDYIISGNNQ